MAFKVLSEEEKVFLTDEELLQYEERLEIYQERVAFVERLEKIQNAFTEEYVPKFKGIKKIRKVAPKSFKMPENKQVKIDSVNVKPVIGIFNKINSIDSNVLKKCNEIKMFDRSYIDNALKKNTGINRSFETPDISHVSDNIPKVKTPKLKKYDISVDSLKKISANVKGNSTDVVKPVKVKKFVCDEHVPEIDNEIFKKINVKINKPGFVKPDICKLDLNTNVKSDLSVKDVKIDKKDIIGTLNTEVKCDIRKINFKKPDIKADMPKVKVKTDIKITKYTSGTKIDPKIPEINISKVKKKTFEKPVVSVKISANHNVRDISDIKFTYTKPQRQEVNLNTDIKTVRAPQFKSPDVNISDMNRQKKQLDSILSKCEKILSYI